MPWLSVKKSLLTLLAKLGQYSIINVVYHIFVTKKFVCHWGGLAFALWRLSLFSSSLCLHRVPLPARQGLKWIPNVYGPAKLMFQGWPSSYSCQELRQLVWQTVLSNEFPYGGTRLPPVGKLQFSYRETAWLLRDFGLSCLCSENQNSFAFLLT